MAAEVARLPPVVVLDTADAASFATVLGPLFEEAPAFLASLAARRPLGTWPGLFAVGLEVALALPDAAKVELLDAHPRIGADPAMVSALSFVEQGFDRDRPENPGSGAAAEAASDAAAAAARVAGDLARLNGVYEARFGFRFVVFVAGRSRAEIVPLLEAALGARRDVEMERGLRDVIAIGAARAAKLGIPEEEGT